MEAANIQGDRPLHHVVRNNCLDSAELLLSRGANLEAKNINGNTPLPTTASFKHSLEIAGLLIDQGANLGATNNAGNTPLHLLCERRATLSILVYFGPGLQQQ